MLLLAGVRVWNARQVQETGAGPSSGGLGGALLGPEKSGGPLRSRLRMVGVLLVFLWLFGCWIVDASIFVAVLLRSIEPSLVQLLLFWVGLCGWGFCWFVFVVFVCVATSYEGRMVDALASRADEGRRSLR